MPTKNKPLVSRPKDRSLASYKAWITEMTKHINPQSDGSSMTEDKWKQAHEKFWAKADAKK